MYPTTVLPRDFLMARILRRRIARHTPSAMSRRDTASEINQWLKLGLTAAQIGEKLIPDDPTMTKEQMHAIIRARMAGADAPPSAARRVVDTAIEDYISPGQSAAGVASSQASSTPRPLTPPAAPVPRSEFAPTLGMPTMDPAQQEFSDRLRALRTVSAPIEEKIAMAAAANTSPEERAAWVQQIALDLFGGPGRTRATLFDRQGGPVAVDSPEHAMREAEFLVADAEGDLAFAAEDEEVAATAAQPGSPEAQDVANSAIKELAVEAPKAATSADQVIDMYDKLVEASGPRNFFESLGFNMADRMDAVNKAFLTNLNKSPLARKGSGAELRAATALVLQRAREAEGAKSRGAKAAAVTAANKESDRRFKRSQKEYDRRLSKQKGKDLAAFERRVRLKIFEGLLEGKDGKLPTPAKRAIEAQMKARRTLAGEAAKLEEIKKDFPGGEEGLNEAIASYRESGRVSSKYDNAWSLYYPVLLNYKMAKAEMDKQEELIQEYATRTGTFIPPLTALNEEVNAKLKEGVGADSGSAVITNKARQAMLNSGMPPEQVDRILGKKRVSLEEATDIAGSKFQR